MPRRAEIADTTGRTRAHDARFADGQPLDAGSVQLHLCNDLGVITKESARHLFTDFHAGANAQTKLTGSSDGYDDLVDTERSTGLVASDAPDVISWAYAFRYGPFPILCDREQDDGSLAPREVRVKVRCLSGSGTSLLVIVALGDALPPRPDRQPLAIASGNAPSSAGNLTFTLSAAGRPPSFQRQVRIAASGAQGVSANAVEAYVWLGTKSGNSGDRLYSSSAWELTIG